MKPLFIFKISIAIFFFCILIFSIKINNQFVCLKRKRNENICNENAFAIGMKCSSFDHKTNLFLEKTFFFLVISKLRKRKKLVKHIHEQANLLIIKLLHHGTKIINIKFHSIEILLSGG